MSLIVIPFFSPVSTKETQTFVLSELESAEILVISPEDFLKNKAPLESHQIFFLVGTGGTENAIADFIDKYNIQAPITLLSYNLNNSLPAAMEIRTYLAKLGSKVKIQHGKIKEMIHFLHKQENYLKIKESLKNLRLGMIGTPSEWLIASQVDEKLVKKQWGLDIIKIPMDNLIDLKNQEKLSLGILGKKFLSQAKSCNITTKELIRAESVISVLQEFIEKYKLSAFSVECFTFVLETGITSCLALSYFNDLGVVAGCEGDIPSAVSMFILNQVSNKPIFMANVVDLDLEQNTVIFAHCTVPTKVLSSYSITSHFETSKSVAIRGKFIEGQVVTIFKIGGRNLTDFWVARGTIVKNLENEFACRTQIEIHLEKSVDYFLKESIANHHCIVPGDYVQDIEEFFLEFC
ncbi:MAG: fucose isomerase [Candidatus Hodarchaeales archaeon]